MFAIRITFQEEKHRQREREYKVERYGKSQNLQAGSKRIPAISKDKFLYEG